MSNVLNRFGNPHYIAEYTKGSKVNRMGGVSGLPTGTVAAKCRCGWEGEGEEAIDAHRAELRAWIVQNTVWPPVARAGDPDTSKQAAASLPNRKTLATALLRVYGQAGQSGATADEAASGLPGGPVDGAWKRVSDLSALGLIAPTGEKRPGRSGRLQRVHAITDAGRNHLAGLEQR